MGPGRGGLQPAPLNAPPAGLAAAGVQPGVTNAVIFANRVIVFGTGEGVFVYNGTPGLGNPPIAWMGGGLVDPFGNVLPSTTGVAGSGSFAAGDIIVNDNGFFLYNGTPSSTSLAYSITNTNVLDPFGTTTGIGFCSYQVGFQASLTAGELNFGTAAGSTVLAANDNGTMKATTATGYSGTLPLTGIDSAIHTVTQAAMNPLSDAWPVPADDANQLTAYILRVEGSGTTGTSQETLSFQVAAFGAVFGPFTVGASQFLVSTNFAWALEAKIAWNTAATARCSIKGSASVSGANLLTTANTVNATIPITFFQGATAVSNAAASTVQLEAEWGSAAVGATISCGIQDFERRGA